MAGRMGDIPFDSDMGHTDDLQQGVVASGDLNVTPTAPGAAAALTAALGVVWILSSGGILTRHVLAVNTGAGNLPADPANNTSRLDAVYAVFNGPNKAPTLQIVQGTAQAGAATVTLDNRTGAGAAPANSVRLRDYLLSNNAGVTTRTSRDRRPWARGAYTAIKVTGGSNLNVTSTSYLTIQSILPNQRLEASGVPVRMTLRAFHFNTTAGAYDTFAPLEDQQLIEASTVDVFPQRVPNASDGMETCCVYEYTPAAGSHLYGWAAKVSAGTGTIDGDASHMLFASVEELVRQNTNNGTA